jgi:hypothetical protein
MDCEPFGIAVVVPSERYTVKPDHEKLMLVVVDVYVKPLLNVGGIPPFAKI